MCHVLEAHCRRISMHKSGYSNTDRDDRRLFETARDLLFVVCLYRRWRFVAANCVKVVFTVKLFKIIFSKHRRSYGYGLVWYIYVKLLLVKVQVQGLYCTVTNSTKRIFTPQKTISRLSTQSHIYKFYIYVHTHDRIYLGKIAYYRKDTNRKIGINL